MTVKNAINQAGYIPNHEIGNLFSYLSSDQITNNPQLRTQGAFTDELFEIDSSDTFPVTAGGATEQSFVFNSQRTNRNRHSSTVAVNNRASYEIEVGGSVPLVKGLVGSFSIGFKGQLRSNYEAGQISTFETTVTESNEVLFRLGAANGSILGSLTYTVTPYLYWANNGALVLDYAVDPILGNGVQSWWEANYSEAPDLALNLPWRYDAEKGLGSTDPEVQREQTPNIVFDPIEPRAGELVDIVVRIHYYSISPTPAPASTVHLYVGDPRDGGRRIIAEDGTSQLSTPPLASRQRTDVILRDWRVPPNLGSGERIYAVIDEAGSVEEIHENNNIGWRVLRPLVGQRFNAARPDGWFSSDWFGFSNVARDPWLRHANFGWLFLELDSSEDEFILRYAGSVAGWLWTSEEVFPYHYAFADGLWYFATFPEDNDGPPILRLTTGS